MDYSGVLDLPTMKMASNQIAFNLVQPPTSLILTPIAFLKHHVLHTDRQIQIQAFLDNQIEQHKINNETAYRQLIAENQGRFDALFHDIQS